MIWVGTRSNLAVYNIQLLRAACLVAILCFAVSSLAFAQGDPLKPSNMPTIDTNCADYPANIWVTDTMQKVQQQAGTVPACGTAGNNGGNKWGIFYGTQNEFVDFQVHIQAPSGGYSALNVAVSNFVQSAPSSYTISNGTFSSSNPPKIVVYREAYMDVTIKTSTMASYYNSTGYYPDILIPAVDPYWGQTTNAFPYSQTAGYNQSVWVDVLIPPSAPSGYYKGTVTVSNGGTVLATLPVIIGVWQWPAAEGGQMPSTTTLAMEESGFGFGALCSQMYNPNSSSLPSTLNGSYPGAGTDINSCTTYTWADATQLELDHRFGGGGQNIMPGSGSFSSFVTTVGPSMNGTCNLHGGQGTTCPLLSGAKDTTMGVYPCGESCTSAVMLNWQSNYDANGWGSNGTLPLYNYLCDEPPSGCSWASIISNYATQHAYFTSTTPIPELVTTDLPTATSNNAQSSIDILVTEETNLEYPFNNPTLQNLSAYATWLTSNVNGVARHWWSYQDCEEARTCTNGSVGPVDGMSTSLGYPNRHVDGKPAANRAQEWLTFLHGQSGELYYDADFCDYPPYGSQCSYPSAIYDPWKSIYYSGGWGDGTILYAGSVGSSNASQDNYMGPGVTIPLILPSVRLKHARDGVQDYEYLHLLTNEGQGSLVNTEISSWITNTYTFETTGTGLETARLALGAAMHHLTYPTVLLPPPSISGTLQ